MKIMASSPIISWQLYGETLETVTDIIFLGSKITTDATAIIKIKDACTLEEKLWPACCADVLSYDQIFGTPWTIAHLVPLSMEFSR